MLFLSESILDTREQLLLDVENGKLDSEQMFRKALALDPDDHFALTALAKRRADAGDLADAEEMLWRAIQAQPCSWLAYMGLSKLLKDQAPLSMGLAELACRKILLDPEAIEEMADEDSSVEIASGMEGLEGLGAAERFEVIADGLRAGRDLEPLAVTARLRSLRLVHELQESEDIEPELVDAVLSEGESIVPLLMGLLRGWAQHVLADEDRAPVENGMALLGEIGDVSAIPSLLEMSTIEDVDLSSPADWALDRIIEQHPDQAANVFSDIAAGLDVYGKIALATKLFKMPQMVVTADLLERLFENLEGSKPEHRELCFEVLTNTAIVVLGPPGIDLARTMLRLHGTVLSRKSRRVCEDTIQELSSMTIPSRPPAEQSAWTVYDICAGKVHWDEEEASMEDDDEFLPPETVHRGPRPGRNDPCWCGSGKKYKKCHLDSDEAPRKRSPQAAFGEFDDLRTRIGEFMSRIMAEHETADAIAELYGNEKQKDKIDPMVLVDWIIHDRISPSLGRTVMEEYFKRKVSSLTDRERAFLESSTRSYIDLLEVLEVREGTGLEVKSLTSGEAFFVHDISMSKVMSRWDGLYARVINGERGLEFSGTGVQVPRMYLEAVRRRLEEEKQRSGLSWPEYLKRNWPSVRAQHAQVTAGLADSLKVTNNDGEELVVSQATYQVVDRDALLDSLRSAAKIHEDEVGKFFVWVSAEENGTVLGTMRIADGTLVLECNSKERFERGKDLLAELAGASVKFEKDEFTTVEDLKRNIKENPSPPRSAKDEIPRDVKERVEREYMEDHYAKWLDMKLPALDGKTPRQAVKNAAGKRKVAELLKQIENLEAHKRKSGESAYDVSKLRAALGIRS